MKLDRTTAKFYWGDANNMSRMQNLARANSDFLLHEVFLASKSAMKSYLKPQREAVRIVTQLSECSALVYSLRS